MEKLIKKFTQAAKNHHTASLAGDWGSDNRNLSIIRNTVKRIRGLGEPGMEALLSLTDNEDLSITFMAIVYSIKYATDKCIAVLTRIAKEPGLLGFDAEQALRLWNEGGEV